MKTLITLAALTNVSLGLAASASQAQTLDALPAGAISDGSLNYPPVFGEPQVVPSDF